MPMLKHTDRSAREWTSHNCLHWDCDEHLVSVRYVYDGPDYDDVISHYWELSRPHGKFESCWEAMDAATNLRRM